MVEKLRYNYSMSVMEKISKMVAMMLYWIIYACENYDEIERELTEMSIRNPKSIIMIFVLPATKKCY